MYLFPRLHLPKKAIAEAKKNDQTPDAFYCLALLGPSSLFRFALDVFLGPLADYVSTPSSYLALSLDATGICLVPGDGFGQKDGEVHFRTTALSPGVEEYVSGIEKFHSSFMDKYRD